VNEKYITFFSLTLIMKKNLKAKVNANVKVYLIPKDELKVMDGKPVLNDKYLVYDSKKKKEGK